MSVPAAAGPPTLAPAPSPAVTAPSAPPVPPNDRGSAERTVTADAAQDSAPQTLVVPAPAQSSEARSAAAPAPSTEPSVVPSETAQPEGGR